MSFPEIILTTPRLRLRPMRESDFDALFELFRDPRVMAAFGLPPLEREQVQHWLQRNLEHQQAHGFGLFAVELAANGMVIGNCGLELMEIGGQPAAELGYDFRSEYWNQGYASEAAVAVRDYALRQLPDTRLVSLIRQGNHASRRVAEKVGMQLADTLQRHNHYYWLYELQPGPV